MSNQEVTRPTMSEIRKTGIVIGSGTGMDEYPGFVGSKACCRMNRVRRDQNGTARQVVHDAAA